MSLAGDGAGKHGPGGGGLVGHPVRGGKLSRKDGASPERAPPTKLPRSAFSSAPGGPLLLARRMAPPPRKCNPKFLPFEEALVYAQALQVYSPREWKAWCKTGARPPNMPSNPDATYRHGGWMGWSHWLGMGNVPHNLVKHNIERAKLFLPFEEAAAYARSLGHKSQKEWVLWNRSGERPASIPSNPNTTCKHSGWQGWGHWLGTGNVATKRPLLPFREALAVAHGLKLSSVDEWEAWRKSGARPANMPARPGATFKDKGWQGWGALARHRQRGRRRHPRHRQRGGKARHGQADARPSSGPGPGPGRHRHGQQQQQQQQHHRCRHHRHRRPRRYHQPPFDHGQHAGQHERGGQHWRRETTSNGCDNDHRHHG